MGILLGILALPALGGPQMVQWLAQTIASEALRQSLDETKVKSELLDLQQRLDSNEIEEADYDRRERDLLERLNLIRRTKSPQGHVPAGLS